MMLLNCNICSVAFHFIHKLICVFLSIQSGEIDVVNHRTGDRCHLKFAPYSYFSRDVARKVSHWRLSPRMQTCQFCPLSFFTLCTIFFFFLCLLSLPFCAMPLSVGHGGCDWQRWESALCSVWDVGREDGMLSCDAEQQRGGERRRWTTENRLSDAQSQRAVEEDSSAVRCSQTHIIKWIFCFAQLTAFVPLFLLKKAIIRVTVRHWHWKWMLLIQKH